METRRCGGGFNADHVTASAGEVAHPDVELGIGIALESEEMSERSRRGRKEERRRQDKSLGRKVGVESTRMGF